ncbi:hypothetical protein GCM10022395_26390 [Snuella lapsa]|uniref:3-keto-alpha-glucoside-1,2-lyase/3-keto-2-hydroxy-glucal hydratase domain-containing protein n=1 Tax=Snuella lapsa TaxID=870481 RepID=A0ABP6Y227_9FLAO
MMKRFLNVLAVCLLIVSCKNTGNKQSNQTATATEDMTNETKANETSKWQYLFDGTSTEGWRGFNSDKLPESWIIEKGTLKSLGKGGDIGGDIVYGAEAFGEFELSLEWKIAEGGNSGIFYHAIEGEQYKAPYYNAPEYQVIDQIGFPQKLEPWQSVAADYGMYDPDFEGAVKKAGEWNTSRIIFTNKKVSYWLNGKKTVEFVP